MKHHLIILVLAFLLVAFPTSFKSQTHKSSVKTQKVKQNSDEVQAKKIIKQFIDGIFIKRKFLPILQNLFSFAPCDKIDKEFLDQNCTAKDLFPFKFGRKLGFRTMAIGWKYMFEEFYFVLGTIPINKDSDEAYPYTSSDYDKLKSEVLKKNNASFSDFELAPNFEKSNKKDIEKKLNEIEKNVDEIENIVFKGIDNELYKKNVEIMKETITIEKKVENNRKYHVVYVEGLVFWFILAKRDGQLKIVGIGDSI